MDRKVEDLRIAHCEISQPQLGPLSPSFKELGTNKIVQMKDLMDPHISHIESKIDSGHNGTLFLGSVPS